MKIRIFALAKELGMDSKELIDLCATAGIQLKNSALASISPEERDVVLGLLKKGGSAKKPSAEPSPLAPTRDDAESAAKLREIRKMPARPQPMRPATRHEASEALEPTDEQPVEVEEAPHVEAPVAEPTPEPAPVAVEAGAPEEPIEAAPVVAPEAPATESLAPAAVSAPAAEVPALPVEPAPVPAPAAKVEAKPEARPERPSTKTMPLTPRPGMAARPAPGGPGSMAPAPRGQGTAAPQAPAPARPAAPTSPPVAASAAAPQAPARPPAPAPLSRNDYIAASGASHRRPTRYEMTPRGSVAQPPGGGTPGSQGSVAPPQDQDSRGPKRDRGKGMPAVAMPPKMEMPAKKPTKPDEGPAQKPTLKLTPGMISASPLGKQVTTRDARKIPRDVNRIGKSGRTLEAELMDLVEAQKKGKAGVPGQSKKTADTGRRRSGKLGEDEGDRPRKMRVPRVKRKGNVVLKTTAEIELPITVRTLSEAIGRPAKDLLKLLFQRGSMAKINDSLEEDLALELSMELGVDLTVIRERDLEAELVDLFEGDDKPEDLVPRPPIVTILGHVDHGKTTLVDKIRSTSVAAGEAGGITQHIAAYQVEHNGQKLTFVDTPGHAAFGEMRARGANVTDIVVLVVSAADGVMPQTIECISHAKSAKVPIVVAINKIDLPTANPQRVMQQLAQHDVLVTAWGGEVEAVETSGATGQGVDTLLETLLLTAEINELKANPDRAAVGVCLESFRDEGRGSLAWLIVQKGTLCRGDIVLCGQATGRIRAIYDDHDNELEEAPPSTPVKVAGLDLVPNAGDQFYALDNLDIASHIAETRRQRGRFDVLAGRRQKPRTLDEILEAARGGAVQDLPLILKVDTPGSLEALRHEIGKIDHPEVRVQIIHEGVGGVNESDVALAHAGGAIIVAFHVIPEDRAQAAAERDGVDIRRYDIIYEVTGYIKTRLEGLLIPEKRQVNTGRAIVLRTFSISRIGTVAGCRVLGGTIERSNRIQVIRDQKVLNEYGIASLKREKDDAKEVREGFECGIRLEGFNDVKEGDLLQAYKIEEVKRTLE